ncbi:TlyA family RNA methyltransferase [Limnobacter parvus]|uniref:TlyA family RNA methyltransferase n=1 Tax=Limnobacter parvus TaxID=2939690 RepID=A0ABT1XIJ3_9BURK|nr:TlyA family RNA methyltransferase [Limnobacter parvus]MCR2746403.1 TlyA family RNA methyltransferase [Limnobacter parvus]
MRADLALVEKGLCPSRAQAQILIEQGKVLMRNGLNKPPAVIKKASQQIEPFMELELIHCDAPNFVSRGGLKLHHALEHTQIKIENKRCIDLGQSTGGFTDCLLQRGAHSVVGLDVGKDQLHPSLKQHPAVLAIEGVNLYKVDARELAQEIVTLRADFTPFDFAVADLSFISLRKVLPNVAALLPTECECLFLVKPQFELGPEHIGKNGLVKNLEGLIAQLETEIQACCTQLDMQTKEFFPCDLKGGDGNQEYFVHAVKN